MRRSTAARERSRSPRRGGGSNLGTRMTAARVAPVFRLDRSRSSSEIGRSDAGFAAPRQRGRARRVLAPSDRKPKGTNPAGGPAALPSVGPGAIEGRGEPSRAPPVGRLGLRPRAEAAPAHPFGVAAAIECSGSLAIRPSVASGFRSVGPQSVPPPRGPLRVRARPGAFRRPGIRLTFGPPRSVLADVGCRSGRSGRPDRRLPCAGSPRRRVRAVDPAPCRARDRPRRRSSGRRLAHPPRSAIAAARASSRSASRTWRTSTSRPSSTATPAPRARAST